ncbi:unnamed protein product [Closterium sp. NIES-53]
MLDLDLMLSIGSGGYEMPIVSGESETPIVSGDSAQRTAIPRVESESAGVATAAQQHVSQAAGVCAAVGDVAGADADDGVTADADAGATYDACVDAEDDASAAQQHVSHAAGVRTTAGADADTISSNADATAIRRGKKLAVLFLKYIDDATAEQQHGSQRAFVRAAAGDVAGGADAADADNSAIYNADAGAKGGATAEQQHGSQGAGVGAAVTTGGDTAGAGDGGTRLTFTGLLQQIKRRKIQAGASGSNHAAARPKSTKNMRRNAALGNTVSLGDAARESGGVCRSITAACEGGSGAVLVTRCIMGDGNRVLASENGGFASSNAAAGDEGGGGTARVASSGIGDSNIVSAHLTQSCTAPCEGGSDKVLDTSGKGNGGSGTVRVASSSMRDGDRASPHLSEKTKELSEAALKEHEPPAVPEPVISGKRIRFLFAEEGAQLAALERLPSLGKIVSHIASARLSRSCTAAGDEGGSNAAVGDEGGSNAAVGDEGGSSTVVITSDTGAGGSGTADGGSGTVVVASSSMGGDQASPHLSEKTEALGEADLNEPEPPASPDLVYSGKKIRLLSAEEGARLAAQRRSTWH